MSQQVQNVKPFVEFQECIIKRIKNGSTTEDIYIDRVKKWLRCYLINILLIWYLVFTSPINFYFGFIHRMISVFHHIPKTRKHIEKHSTFWKALIGIFVIPYITFYLLSRPIYLLIDLIQYAMNRDLNKSKLYNQTLRLSIFAESWIQLIYLLKQYKSYDIMAIEFDKTFYHNIFKECGIYFPISYAFDGNLWCGTFPKDTDLLIKPSDGTMGYHQSFWKFDKSKDEYINDNLSLKQKDLLKWVQDQSKDPKIGYDSFIIQNHLKMNKYWDKYHVLVRISTLKLLNGDIVPFLAELTISSSWTSHQRLGIIYCDLGTGKPISFVNRWFGLGIVDIDVKKFEIPTTLYISALELAVKAHKALPTNIFPDHSWDILISNEGICFLEGSYFGARCTHYFFDSFDILRKHLKTYRIL